MSRFQTASSVDTLKKGCGTICYCSPEMFSLQGLENGYSTKCDIYSTAIIFYEMGMRVIIGKHIRPFVDLSSDLQIVNAVVDGKRPSLSKFPPSLARLLEDGWKQNPEERIDTKALLQRLSKVEADFNENVMRWSQLCPLSKLE